MSTHGTAKPINAHNARTHLPRLLARVARGERFVITRHGEPIAQLIPFEAGDTDSVEATLRSVATIRRNLSRKGVTLADCLKAGETVRKLAHADHRY